MKGSLISNIRYVIFSNFSAPIFILRNAFVVCTLFLYSGVCLNLEGKKYYLFF